MGNGRAIEESDKSWYPDGYMAPQGVPGLDAFSNRFGKNLVRPPPSTWVCLQQPRTDEGLVQQKIHLIIIDLIY